MAELQITHYNIHTSVFISNEVQMAFKIVKDPSDGLHLPLACDFSVSFSAFNIAAVYCNDLSISDSLFTRQKTLMGP